MLIGVLAWVMFLKCFLVLVLKGQHKSNMPSTGKKNEIEVCKTLQNKVSALHLNITSSCLVRDMQYCKTRRLPRLHGKRPNLCMGTLRNAIILDKEVRHGWAFFCKWRLI
jgi:hypothetical protein